MTTTFKQIADSALELSVQERAELAHVIIASIDEDRHDLYPAWDIELKKRVGDIRQGKVKGIPAEEVFAKLEEKYWENRIDEFPGQR
jgi:putative addiction module component (TIGR02574 family)